MMEGDLIEKIIASAIEHWPLVVGTAASFYWLMPKILKAFFMNGGGEIIKKIVNEENIIQSALHKSEVQAIVNEAIRTHEVIEAKKIEDQLALFKSEIYGSLPKDRRNRH